VSLIIPIDILVWKPEYSMYVPELDQKTRLGYQAVNDFHRAMLAGRGRKLSSRLSLCTRSSPGTTPITMAI
jgi:hypothetical protein